MEMGERFRRSQRVYQRSDGSAWTGAELERASGAVTRHHVSELRNGYYRDPGLLRIEAIGRAMGVPLEERTRPE